MSIINDALKKTQQKFQQHGPKQGQEAQEPPDKNPWFWLIAIVVSFGFIGCGLIFIFLVFPFKKTAVSFTNNPQKQTLTGAKQASVTMFAKPSVAMAKKDEPKDTIVLNGIITMDDGQFALINNQILKEGDYINGKRIVSISADKVEIFDKGQILTLTTKP